MVFTRKGGIFHGYVSFTEGKNKEFELIQSQLHGNIFFPEVLEHLFQSFFNQRNVGIAREFKMCNKNAHIQNLLWSSVVLTVGKGVSFNTSHINLTTTTTTTTIMIITIMIIIIVIVMIIIMIIIYIYIMWYIDLYIYTNITIDRYINVSYFLIFMAFVEERDRAAALVEGYEASGVGCEQ